LKEYNLVIYKIDNLTIHGGSNRYFIKRIKNKITIDKSVKEQRKKEIKYGLDKKNAFFKFKKRVEKSKKN